MEAGEELTMSVKPVPIPRHRIQTETQDTKNNNKSKPVPLPRKILQRLGTTSGEKKKGKDTVEPPPSPTPGDDAKRTTINIFKRGRTIDPFEEFEKEFPVPHLLSKVTFQSPLNELSQEARARLSFSSTSSANQSDSSDYYDQPQFTKSNTSSSISNQHPIRTPPQKPVRRYINNRTSLKATQKTSGESGEESSTYESISIFSSQEPVYSKLKKHIQIGSSSNGALGKNTPISNVMTSRKSALEETLFDPVYGQVKDEVKRAVSLPPFSHFVQQQDVQKHRPPTAPSAIGTKSLVKSLSTTQHAYDDVALEDGTLVFLDNQLNTRPKPIETAAQNTSRNSVVMEFDPLFDLRETLPVPARNTSLVEGDPNPYRYEFIETDGEEESSERSSVVIPEPPINDPPSRPESATTGEDFGAGIDEAYEEVIPRHLTKESEDVVSDISSGSFKRIEGNGSFLRRLSHKIRLIPIREEGSGGGPGTCGKCHAEHAVGARCKTSPVARDNIVFSSFLYRPEGLLQKEFTKRWAVLAKGKLTFYNDKSVVLEEIPLEKGLVIAKTLDTRIGSNGTQLKPFEIQFVGGKSSSLQVAGTSDGERASWMQKWIEAFSSVFPTHVISTFDRGGWCFIKESVTSEWRASWLVLKGRRLFQAFSSGEDFFELDLRKVRSVNMGTKDVEQKCPFVENADVLTVDMISRILFIQTEMTKVTSSWEKVLSGAAKQNGANFEEMQLTMDDVPVIVDKCIDFLYAHGTLAEGIYRQSGSNTRITQLLADFQKDSWSVQISHKEFSAHDVAGTLKRFFRTLPDPLFSEKLYEEWIATSRGGNEDTKMRTYENLLDALPPINYNILKKLICHLYAVHELHEKNLMPLNNLAPIWGPTLMNIESPLKMSRGMTESDEQYRSACAESEVLKDLIRNYYTLFRVDSASREKEKKMQDALENFHLGATKRKCSGDMKMWIYIWEKDETTAINITLTPQGTAQNLVQQLCRMAQLRNYDNLSLHEVICGKSLERPLHPSEIVIETVLRWSIWDIDERRDNYLLLKKNTLYPALLPYAKDPTAVYGDFKFADSKSKSFKKYAFKFGRAMLKYYKDSKAGTELGSWKIEDIVWYMGCERRRSPSPRWAFTFVKRNYPFKRSREEPYFGNVVSCGSEEELHKWIAAMVVGEHPAGLYPAVIV